jgi:hypothetical protein
MSEIYILCSYYPAVTQLLEQLKLNQSKDPETLKLLSEVSCFFDRWSHLKLLKLAPFLDLFKIKTRRFSSNMILDKPRSIAIDCFFFCFSVKLGMVGRRLKVTILESP